MSRQLHTAAGECSGKRLQVVYLTNQLPCPPRSGGQVKEAEVLRAVPPNVSVHLCALTCRYDRDVGNIDENLAVCERISLFESTPEPTRGAHGMPARIASYASPSLSSFLSGMLDGWGPKVIHVEGSFLIRHVPPTSVPIFLFEENIESTIQRESDRVSPSGRPQWRSLRRAELAAWSRAAACGALTDGDATEIRRHAPSKPIWLLSSGYDHIRAGEHVGGVGSRVLFVGNFGWFPTLDTARCLLDLWPRVARAVPDAELVLVGADADAQLQQAIADTCQATYAGEVADMQAFWQRSDLFVCPTRIGGGVSYKMIEAISFGIPTVATAVAVRGLPAKAQRLCVVTGDADGMVEAIIALLLDRDRRRLLAAAMRALRDELPTWTDAAKGHAAAWADTAGSATTPRTRTAHGG